MSNYVIKIGPGQYFSAANGYDRQSGVTLNEATIVTETQLERILSRLRKYGVYGIEQLHEVQIETGSTSDDVVELSSDEDSMTAVDQAEIADQEDELDLDLDSLENDELDLTTTDEDEDEDEERAITKQELELMKLDKPFGLDVTKNVVRESTDNKVSTIKLNTPISTNDSDEVSMIKNRISKELESNIKSEIDRLINLGNADDNSIGNGGIKSELTAAQALKDVLDLIKDSDSESGFKRAQLQIASLMSPVQDVIDKDILHRFLSGRTHIPLKDIYNKVKVTT